MVRCITKIHRLKKEKLQISIRKLAPFSSRLQNRHSRVGGSCSSCDQVEIIEVLVLYQNSRPQKAPSLCLLWLHEHASLRQRLGKRAALVPAGSSATWTATGRWRSPSSVLLSTWWLRGRMVTSCPRRCPTRCCRITSKQVMSLWQAVVLWPPQTLDVPLKQASFFISQVELSLLLNGSPVAF